MRPAMNKAVSADRGGFYYLTFGLIYPFKNMRWASLVLKNIV
jgi:hypothetical protein